MSDPGPDDAAAPDRAAIKVLPPVVPLATVVAGVALNLIWPLGFGIEVTPLERYLAGGAIIVGGVLILGGMAAWLMTRSGQDPNPYKPSPSLIPRGPYRFMRNPMYLAMVLACIGVAILLWNLWIVLLTPLCALVLHYGVVLPEEAYLERRFGADYLAYKARVRRWL